MSSFSTKTNSTFNTFLNILVTFTFFLLIGLLISFLIAEPNKSEATTTSASAGSSVYYASISNDNTVTIPITPTNTQTEYTNTNNIKFTSTCTKGAYVYINTNSASNNSLTRTGSDSGVKTIDAVAGDVTTGLTDNTWGFKTSGKVFSQVPVNTSPAVLYYSTVAETNTDIDVIYGVKLDNTIPSGTYTNDVVYTVAVAPECLAYTLKFNTDGGSTISDQSINYGDTVNLNNYTTTKSGYIFGGWSNGSLDFTGTETTANPNPDNNFTVTLSACWVKNTPYAYDYTGGEQTFTAPCGGYYKLEVWGAEGGTATYTSAAFSGGYGAYSVGVINLKKQDSKYINVGGKGVPCDSTSTTWVIKSGGYNGGGQAGCGKESASLSDSYVWRTATGGGATHIASVSGLLKNLESYKGTLTNNSYYVSNEILIVAGGGGGGSVHRYGGSWQGYGGHGGGVNSVSGASAGRSTQPTVATQLAGGQGYNRTNLLQIPPFTASGFGYATGTADCFTDSSKTDCYGSAIPGGGGGWYGGAGSVYTSSSGGSGYISSSNLISTSTITKHMTCYSCTTSSVAATRTNSNTNVSATATSDYSKTGNGYAKILYLGASV